MRLLHFMELLVNQEPSLALADRPSWVALRAAIANATRGSELDTLEDELDPYVCAYVGLCFLAGQTVTVGSPVDGYIVTPMDEPRRARLGVLMSGGEVASDRGRRGAEYLPVMPELARFFGIVITMNYDDHLPPHFHARYGDDRATFRIDGAVLAGSMSKRAISLVRD